jgi:hypothetical protein
LGNGGVHVFCVTAAKITSRPAPNVTASQTHSDERIPQFAVVPLDTESSSAACVDFIALFN